MDEGLGRFPHSVIAFSHCILFKSTGSSKGESNRTIQQALRTPENEEAVDLMISAVLRDGKVSTMFGRVRNRVYFSPEECRKRFHLLNTYAIEKGDREGTACYP